MSNYWTEHESAGKVTPILHEREIAMKRFALALTVTLTAFLGLGQIATAQYSASSSTSTTDGKTTVVYSGCVNGETITFTLVGATPTPQTAVCAGGKASVVFSSAAGLTGTAKGTTSPSTTFTVASLAPTATAPGVGLPATGSNGIGTTAGLAIGLLVVGLGLFVVAQVRRRQPNLA